MNIQAMMKQAQAMQEKMDKAQKELAKQTFTVEKQGVTVVMTGDKRVKSIDINEILVDPEDKDILEDLMTIAINEGIEQIEQIEEEMQPTMPGGNPF